MNETTPKWTHVHVPASDPRRAIAFYVLDEQEAPDAQMRSRLARGEKGRYLTIDEWAEIHRAAMGDVG